MKNYLLITFTLFATAFTALNTTWTNDDAHSTLGFTVTHLGINDVTGTFNDIDITLEASKDDFSDAEFSLEAKTASIDTEVEARNNHLKSADFFEGALWLSDCGIFIQSYISIFIGKNYTVRYIPGKSIINYLSKISIQ